MDEIKLTKEYQLELHHLQLPIVEVADNFNLYDLFAMVYQFEATFPGLAAIFGLPVFNQFWDQINLVPDKPLAIDYLELYWGIDYDTKVTPMTEQEIAEWQETSGPDHFFNLFGGKTNNYWDDLDRGTLSSLMGFHGVGSYEEKEIEKWPECKNKKCGYAIELTPLNDLKHLSIKLNKKINFRQPFVEEHKQLSRTDFELTQEPTLWCFITSVFWELTFFGYDPDTIKEARDSLSENLKKAMEEMEDDYED